MSVIKNNKMKIYVLLSLIIIIGFAHDISGDEAIESLDIPAGVGFDITVDEFDNIKYEIPVSVYIFKANGEKYTVTREGKGATIGDTREDRQLKSENEFILGLEKVYLLSEDACKVGLDTTIDILFKNPLMSDTGYAVVCKGKSIDYLQMKMKGYESSADFIANMVRSLKRFNFFSDNYKLIDLYVRFVSEGRNAVLPYIEIIDDQIQVTGLALFDKDKMVKKIGIDEAKYLSMLKFNNVRGILTIQEDAKKYINMSSISKRKVTCKKKNGKYQFNISLKIIGKIVNNELYEDIKTDVSVQKKFEKDMENKVKKDAERFIDKMQHEYKLDCLSLGNVAAAKYGRRTGVDWNKIISESQINVDVKVKVQTNLRGDY